MTGPADRTTRTGPDLPDHEIEDALRRWSVEADGPLSRNRVISRYGIGATRATKLLDRSVEGWRTRTVGNPTRTADDQTGPVEQTDAVEPDRTDDAWTGIVADLVAPTAPVGPDQPADEPDRQPDHDLTPADQAATQTSPAPRRPRIRGLLAGLYVIAASAGVAIWSGWVSLGEMAGFGPVRVLPGIADHLIVNAAVALPLGMEAYAALALRVWIGGGHSDRTRRYARTSTVVSLVTGAAGQVAYHLLAASRHAVAPWPIVTGVSVLPVAVLGMAAGLTHLVVADVRARNTDLETTR